MAHGIYYPTDYGADPAGVADSTSAIQSAYAACAGASPAGGKIRFDPGRYRVKPGIINLSTAGITLGGTGREATTLLIDDTLGNAGAAGVTISANDCRVADLTISSPTARTAGDSLLILGSSNGNITHSPGAQKTQNEIVENVDIENAFVGMHLDDTAAGTNLWGVFAHQIRVLSTAAGGTGIWINTPNGGQHYMHEIYIYGDSTVNPALRPLYGLRIQGCNDIEIGYISTVYTRNGLWIDPPSGSNCNVIMIPFGEFDSTGNTGVPITIAPQAGGSVQGLELGGWASAGQAGTGTNTISISGNTHNVTILDGMFIVSGTNGIVIDGTGGASDIHVGRVRYGALSGTAFHATGSLQHWSHRGNVEIWFGYSPGAAVGVQVDAGCDRYRIDSDLGQSGTPLIDNGGGTKIVQTI